MNGGWSAAPIGSVCNVIAGQSPPGDAYNDHGDGLPFYQGKKEFTDRYLGAPSVWTTYVTKRAMAGDILMSVRAPVGPINETREEICIGRGLAAIRNGRDIDRDYLWYALSWLQPEIAGSDGAVFPSINKSQIEALEIPLPPLEEQTRIVAVLDLAFAALDRARANAEANLGDSVKLFGAYLAKTFSAGGFDWMDRPVGDVLTLQRGFDITKAEQAIGSVPVVSSGGVKSFHNVATAPGPGVVIGRKGSIGSVHYVEEDFWPHDTTLFVKDFKGNHPRLIYYMLCGLDLARLDTGAANPSLNRNLVHPLRVKWPPSGQQSSVAMRLDEVKLTSESVDSRYKVKLAEISALRQSLLQAAFSGQLA